MKATMTLLVVLFVVAGMGLIGDAIAQPADPTPAVSEDSGAGSAAGEVKPDKPATPGETNEAGTAEDKPSKSEEGKTEAKAESDKKAPDGAADQARGIWSAISGGEWLIAISLIMMLLGTLARALGGMQWKFLKSKVGGYTTAIMMGLGVLGVGIYELGFSFPLLMSAFLVTTSAMGMHGAAKDVKEKLKPAAG